jgi:hypothetical protein
MAAPQQSSNADLVRLLLGNRRGREDSGDTTLVEAAQSDIEMYAAARKRANVNCFPSREKRCPLRRCIGQRECSHLLLGRANPNAALKSLR